MWNCFIGRVQLELILLYPYHTTLLQVYIPHFVTDQAHLCTYLYIYQKF